MPRKPTPKRKSKVSAAKARRRLEEQVEALRSALAAERRRAEDAEAAIEEGTPVSVIKAEAREYIKPRSTLGRPGLLTPEVIDAVCSQLTEIGTVEDAADRAGVARSTLYAWLERGREESEGVFRDFLDRVQQAKTDRRLQFEAELRAHGRHEWKAHLELMRLADPKRYAPRVFVHVAEELNDAFDSLEAEFSDDPETLERAISAISERRRKRETVAAAPEETGALDGSDAPVQPADPEPEAEPVP
jgi:hypothetical protein